MTTESVKIEGLSQLEYLWKQAPEITREELTRAATEASLLFEREVIDKTPVGVHGGAGLRGSISSHIKQLKDGPLGIVSSNSPYAVPVELGTKAHFPPIEPLQDWVKHKLGIKDDKEAKGIAFAIALKISKKGTKGQFMFKQTFDEQKENVTALFVDAQERIVRRLAGAA